MRHKVTKQLKYFSVLMSVYFLTEKSLIDLTPYLNSYGKSFHPLLSHIMTHFCHTQEPYLLMKYTDHNFRLRLSLRIFKIGTLREE